VGGDLGALMFIATMFMFVVSPVRS
jgi:hypothetical protein